MLYLPTTLFRFVVLCADRDARRPHSKLDVKA